MTQNIIFSPFFAMVFLTLLVWVYLYIRRIHFISRSTISLQDLTPNKLAELSPPEVSNPSDNFKNLFELPILFYALIFYLFVTQQVDAAYVIAAWVFVGFRAVHSVIHCTFNRVIFRFYTYLFSSMALWFIAIRAAFEHFSL
jgi:hypothetical protein